MKCVVWHNLDVRHAGPSILLRINSGRIQVLAVRERNKTKTGFRLSPE
jgi:hypothetical protein